MSVLGEFSGGGGSTPFSGCSTTCCTLNCLRRLKLSALPAAPLLLLVVHTVCLQSHTTHALRTRIYCRQSSAADCPRRSSSSHRVRPSTQSKRERNKSFAWIETHRLNSAPPNKKLQQRLFLLTASPRAAASTVNRVPLKGSGSVEVSGTKDSQELLPASLCVCVCRSVEIQFNL